MTKNKLTKEISENTVSDITAIIDGIDDAMDNLRFEVRHYMSNEGIDRKAYDRIFDLFADLAETRNDAVRARRAIFEAYLIDEEEEGDA